MKYFKVIFSFVTIILIMSCSITKNLQKTKFKFYTNGKAHPVIFEIPKNNSLEKLKASAEAGAEDRYWYKDSAVVYISNFKYGSTLNYTNIRDQKNAYSRWFMADTITLSGVDELGRYWKEVKYYSLYYGYSNVKEDGKEHFDQAISSVKIK